MLILQKYVILRPRREYGAAFACILCVLSLFLTGCKADSAYELKLDAIRVIDPGADKVGMSVWIYDFEGALIRHFFTPGRLDPVTSLGSWVPLNDPDFEAIPASSVPDSAGLVLQIKLNPNRFLTPPDAVFFFAMTLDDILQEPYNILSQVVRSEDGAYELQLRVRAREAREKEPSVAIGGVVFYDRPRSPTVLRAMRMRRS